MHIALTGLMGTGKGEVSKKLQEKGFKYLSLSNIVREEAEKRNLPQTRENLQEIGNDLRKNFGPNILAVKTREIIEKENSNFVIDGIRNPNEIIELKKIPNLHLLAITADERTIIERIKSRARQGEESSSEEEIIKKLQKEKGIGEDPNGQQVQKCIEIADFLIINENSLENLSKKIDHFIALQENKDRPTFDETLMEIAYTWAKRSTCLRRKVGAVVAKDKQQLTAGYNGAPRGIPHCAETGCIREKLNVPSGKNAELCRGTHAEQNAITQAAKFGISLEGATLYCNTFPCVICTKMILNSGITKVIYDCDYNDPLSKEILSQQKQIEMIRYEGKKIKI